MLHAFYACIRCIATVFFLFNASIRTWVCERTSEMKWPTVKKKWKKMNNLNPIIIITLDIFHKWNEQHESNTTISFFLQYTEFISLTTWTRHKNVLIWLFSRWNKKKISIQSIYDGNGLWKAKTPHWYVGVLSSMVGKTYAIEEKRTLFHTHTFTSRKSSLITHHIIIVVLLDGGMCNFQWNA